MIKKLSSLEDPAEVTQLMAGMRAAVLETRDAELDELYEAMAQSFRAHPEPDGEIDLQATAACRTALGKISGWIGRWPPK